MPPLLVYIRGAIKYAWNGPSSSFYWYVSEYQPRSHQNLITVAAGLAFWLNTLPRAGERYLNTAAAPRSWRHRVTLHWSLCGQPCSQERTGDCVLCVVHCGPCYYCIIWNTNIELWRDIACCCWTLQRTTQEKCCMIHTAGAEAGIWIKLSISKTIKLHFSPHHIPSSRDGLAQPSNISFLHSKPHTFTPQWREWRNKIRR